MATTLHGEETFKSFHCFVQVVFAPDVFDEAYVEPFTIRVSSDMSVQEVKKKILEESRKAFLGPINVDEHRLKVVFNGQLLRKNTTIGEYGNDPRISWPKPYGGSLYVAQNIKAPLGSVPKTHKYR